MGFGRIFQAFGHVEFDRAVAGLEILDGCREMEAKTLGGVVGKDDPVIKLEGFFEDIAEEVRIHAEIDDYLVWGLGNPADIRIAGAQV